MRSISKSEEKKSMTCVEKGEFDTLKVPEFDTYIEHNKLGKNGKKIDKIKQITASTLL